jgi:hypothetical protein
VPPVPQRIALPGFGDGDDVEVGVFIGASLRERAIDDHRAHGGVRFRPRRGSLGHEFSGNGHQHFLSACAKNDHPGLGEADAVGLIGVRRLRPERGIEPGIGHPAPPVGDLLNGSRLRFYQAP